MEAADITYKDHLVSVLALEKFTILGSYHLASELVAPWFVTAASVHCSQNSSHLYPSAYNQQ